MEGGSNRVGQFGAQKNIHGLFFVSSLELQFRQAFSYFGQERSCILLLGGKGGALQGKALEESGQALAKPEKYLYIGIFQ